MKTRLKIAIQMDPLARLNKAGDSTLYLAHTAANRGYELFHYEPQHLRMEITPKGRLITARGHALKFKGDQASVYHGDAATRDLADFDFVLMRQDPPFDLAYIAATHVLEHLAGKARVVNDPVAVRNAPEKLLIAHFPHFMPPTLITRDREAIGAFQKKHGDIVFKPLFGYAGYGIFRLRAGDGNLQALLETMASFNTEPWMVQKFLPAIASAGDKRIVLINGEVAGCFTRIPARGESRGNMRVGGKPVAANLTPRDRAICAEVGPILRKQGIYLAGIDVIGDYLTEINVTSPTGLLVADRLQRRKGKDSTAEKFWNGLLK